MPEDDPEAEYYQAIEEFFVSKRGDPLFLSNPDWLLIRKWRRQGAPLRVVLRGIADAMDMHGHSWGRHQKVGSLSYCTSMVEAALDRWHRALGQPEEGVDTRSFLDSLAGRLEAAPGIGESKLVQRMVAELREPVADDGERLEAWLSAREKKLLRLLEQELGPRVADIEKEIEEQLRPYAARMPARVLEQVRADSRARRVLEAYGIPRLSLFHL